MLLLLLFFFFNYSSSFPIWLLFSKKIKLVEQKSNTELITKSIAFSWCCGQFIQMFSRTKNFVGFFIFDLSKLRFSVHSHRILTSSFKHVIKKTQRHKIKQLTQTNFQCKFPISIKIQ